MRFINLLDYLLIRFANYRAGKMPLKWQGIKEGKAGVWDLGLCTQSEAEEKITKGGGHKIKMVDIENGFIFYE